MLGKECCKIVRHFKNRGATNMNAQRVSTIHLERKSGADSLVESTTFCGSVRRTKRNDSRPLVQFSPAS